MPEIKEGQIWLDTASDAWFRERGMPEKIRRVNLPPLLRASPAAG